PYQRRLAGPTAADLRMVDKPADTEKQAVVKVKATVLLNRDGKDEQVLPSHEFKSGDKVKIVYSTNIDCYVYWLSEGTSGDHYMLFPNEKVGMENWVKKNEESMIPVKGNFKFDEKKGTEKILLVMSPEKIPELDEAAKVAAVKGGTVKSIQDQQEQKRKSRDLVFEEEDNKSSGVSTQSQVSKDIKQPFVVAFELKHN
ncbi:MAG: DUF4384 domain-containing protein, partial [Deltaproteobacteria bacterium]|nr:DUF4384 domain-containing protein [Deltaproteobacteria bacterium]